MLAFSMRLRDGEGPIIHGHREQVVGSRDEHQ